jgi:tetratricopeptide (TPR) repeat protein
VLTFLVGLLGLVVFYTAAMVCGLKGHPVWLGLIGAAGFFAVVIPLNLVMRRKLEAVFKKVQATLLSNQDTLRRKANQIQRSFAGSPKAMQGLLEKEQTKALKEALAIMDEAKPLYRWNMLAERQTNTFRAQLHYQLKEFDEADRLLKKAFIFDPVTQAMKFARQYMRGEKAELDKAFKKAIKPKHAAKVQILCALYSWILVKENRIDDAVAFLAKVKDSADSDVLKANWEHLANGRVKQFSNAGFGDLWYALHLEQPKAVKAPQQFRNANPFR